MAGIEIATGELLDKDIFHVRKKLLVDLRSMLLNSLMSNMPIRWRYRWCGGGACACVGGANCSGGLSENGFTKEEWETWVTANPEPFLKE